MHRSHPSRDKQLVQVLEAYMALLEISVDNRKNNKPEHDSVEACIYSALSAQGELCASMLNKRLTYTDKRRALDAVRESLKKIDAIPRDLLSVEFHEKQITPAWKFFLKVEEMSITPQMSIKKSHLGLALPRSTDAKTISGETKESKEPRDTPTDRLTSSDEHTDSAQALERKTIAEHKKQKEHERKAAEERRTAERKRRQQEEKERALEAKPTAELIFALRDTSRQLESIFTSECRFSSNITKFRELGEKIKKDIRDSNQLILANAPAPGKKDKRPGNLDRNEENLRKACEELEKLEAKRSELEKMHDACSNQCLLNDVYLDAWPKSTDPQKVTELQKRASACGRMLHNIREHSRAWCASIDDLQRLSERVADYKLNDEKGSRALLREKSEALRAKEEKMEVHFRKLTALAKVAEDRKEHARIKHEQRERLKKWREQQKAIKAEAAKENKKEQLLLARETKENKESADDIATRLALQNAQLDERARRRTQKREYVHRKRQTLTLFGQLGGGSTLAYAVEHKALEKVLRQDIFEEKASSPILELIIRNALLGELGRMMECCKKQHKDHAFGRMMRDARNVIFHGIDHLLAERGSAQEINAEIRQLCLNVFTFLKSPSNALKEEAAILREIASPLLNDILSFEKARKRTGRKSLSEWMCLSKAGQTSESDIKSCMKDIEQSQAEIKAYTDFSRTETALPEALLNAATGYSRARLASALSTMKNHPNKLVRVAYHRLTKEIKNAYKSIVMTGIAFRHVVPSVSSSSSSSSSFSSSPPLTAPLFKRGLGEGGSRDVFAVSAPASPHRVVAKSP